MCNDLTRDRSSIDQTTMRILQEVTVDPGKPWGHLLKAGQRVRFIDLCGKQAVDFLCYDAVDSTDRYNAANTIKMQSNIYLGAGSVLWSDRGNRMMRIEQDTCGRHDTVAGCCSSEMNVVRYHKPGPANCRDTFERALGEFGLTRDDIVSNVNWFMRVPVGADGSMAISEGISRPGDYVDLVAERDVICVASNCAQIFNNSNGFEPTPIRVVVYAPRD